MIKRFYQPLVIIFLIVLLSIPLVLPYFHKGYFPTHDGEWAVVRMGDMFRSLRDHQFPVRYSGSLNFGYGYPLFNFAYPAPYYLGTVFHFLKFGFVDSVKMLFALSVVLSALAMYFASKEMWGNRVAGFISAVFYAYLPYRIVDLYARGSIGESLSFVFFPLILFCAAKILDASPINRYIFFGVLSYAALIMTHNIMAVLFTPVLFVFVLLKIFSSKKTKEYLHSVLFIVLSYGLSAFFWLPALLEKHTITLSQVPIADRATYFVTLNQLLTPKWGYGLPDHPDGFSYQIGSAHIAILFILLFLLIFVWIKKKKMYKEFTTKIAAFFCGMAIVFLLLMFSFTSFLWQVTPLLKEINYPWTLLGPIGFLLSLLAGFLWLQNKFIKYIVLVLVVVAVLVVLPHAKPESYIDKGDEYYLTNEATTTSSQELMPLWVKKNPSERNNKKIEIVKGKGVISDIFYNSKKISFSIDLQSNSLVRINTIYYPGWQAFVDGKEVAISYNNRNGVMDFSVPAGKHNVKASFGETTLRMVSDIISLVSLVMLILISSRIKSLNFLKLSH